MVDAFKVWWIHLKWKILKETFWPHGSLYQLRECIHKLHCESALPLLDTKMYIHRTEET